ncbi:E3 ubiquitin-protein ligase listerin-like [Plakobranchus ocellatus]|uniref:E3 ubiquitin-protein ligase listerin n=1 Tax=Plakobranchus ocellatus TaxID=259542 RepID=A0AAV3ZGQ8_9GAST|nr:E3 ubiquitin-protein ligase listerin-like [Plakobranchus ocellatus]
MPGPKKAQRTKGNVKPSSSSQAAQLLAASGHAPTGFIGFSTQPAFVPVSEVFDEAESALDGDFRLILRKLSKRDTVTKIKALQEFSSLCSCKEEDVVKAIVPFWPRIYNKIAIDVDHKVRELAQKATASLASKTGKAMAPHLKSIMGMWVVSMCDTYPTVASAANQAFTSRFPGAKQAEAIRFCRAEIVECLSKNILNHSKQTLSDPQTTSDEDMEAKYHRVVTSSLQGLRKVLGILPLDFVAASMTDDMTTLLESSAFWKHAKSPVPSVRGGMLSLLSAVCQCCPSASGRSISKISPFVFSFLDCSEPTIVSYAWETVLSLSSAHEDCWQHVNWQKAVWPKLKAVLEHGCAGQASIVAPCFLPLLSKIPDISFTRFFESFRLGLTEDSVLNSPIELNAFVKSFVECLQYAVKRLHTESKSIEIKELLLDQLLIVVQGSLTEPKASLSKTELYASLNTFMSLVADVDAEIEKCFWSDLSAFIIGRLQVEFESSKNLDQLIISASPEIFERLKLLVKGLVFKESGTYARKEKVKFSSSFETEETANTLSLRLSSDIRNKDNLSAVTEAFIGDILVATFQMATVEEKRTSQFMSLFSHLVTLSVPHKVAERLKTRTDFVCLRIMEDLGLEPGTCITRDAGTAEMTLLRTQLSSCAENDSDCGSPHRDFIVEHLIPVLFYAERKRSEHIARSTVVSIFALLPYVNDETALKILSFLLHRTSEEFLSCQLIEYILTMSKEVSACKILSETDSFAEQIEKLALNATLSVSEGDAAGDASSKVWKMLTCVISSLDKDDDHTVSQACLDAVMSSCVTTLKQLTTDNDDFRPIQLGQSQSFEAIVGLVHALLTRKKILTHPMLGELVINLLSLLLQSQLSGKEDCSGVQQLWLSGLHLILGSKSDLEIQGIVRQMCDTIQKTVTRGISSMDSLDGVKRVMKLLWSSIVYPLDEDAVINDIRLGQSALGKDIETTLENVDITAASHLIDNLLIEDSPWMDKFHECCDYLYVSNRLHKIPETDSIVITEQPVKNLVLSSFYNLSVLELISGLHREVDSQKEATDVCPFSRVQTASIKNLFAKLVIFEAAMKINCSLLSELSFWVSDLRSKMILFLKGLKTEQLSELVDVVCKENSVTFQLEKLGASSLLHDLRSNMETSKKKLSAYYEIIFKLNSNFIKSQLSESIKLEANTMFDMSEIEDSVCESFSLVFDNLMSHDNDHYDIKSIAQNLSGFLSLISSFDELNMEVKSTLFQQLMVIVNKLKDKNIHLLNSGDSMPVPKDLLELNVHIARALKKMVVASSDQYWEFVLCTLIEWIQFLSECKDDLCSNTYLQALAVSVFELSSEAAQTFSDGVSVEAVSSKAYDFTLTDKAKTEWSEFFAEGVFSVLLPMFVSLSTSDSKWQREIWSLVQTPLCSAVSLCPEWLVLTHQLPPHLTASDTSSLSDSLKTLLNHLCPLLMSRERCVEVTAYWLLRTVVKEIAKQDLKLGNNTKGSKDDEMEEDIQSPPEAFITQIEAAGHILEYLKVAQIDDHIIMDYGTEERSQAMGYLLTWKLLLLLFKFSKDELRAKYAQYFKSQSSVSQLLDHLFRLMPQHPDPSIAEFDLKLAVNVTNKDEIDAEMEWLALHIYRGCLEILPALVRAWWLEQDRKSSNFVDRFTTQYLSKGLIWQQINAAQGNADTEVEGITIKTRPAAREVLAIYEMAEVTVNMTITLPENFPLGKLDVACDKRVGVSQAQWDRWLLQLNIFLQHQNGSIMEGLRIWKGNIDKKFEGLEDCMICFSVIHGTTLQLPRLTCRTCRKKFHSTCLYKWFSTSQKSSCPLCRNLF